MFTRHASVPAYPVQPVSSSQVLRVTLPRLAALRRPHTYMQMISIGVSASPWKRVMESLRIGESVVKETDKQGRTTWRVVAG